MDPATRSSASTATSPSPQVRLRWWAVALPIATFAALLALLASPAQAQQPPERPVASLLSALPGALPRLAASFL